MIPLLQSVCSQYMTETGSASYGTLKNYLRRLPGSTCNATVYQRSPVSFRRQQSKTPKALNLEASVCVRHCLSAPLGAVEFFLGEAICHAYTDSMLEASALVTSS